MKQLLKNTLPALLIAFGLALLGIFIKAGFATFSDRDRTVTVRGLAELEVKANKVTWPIVFKQVGNDLTAIYDQNQATNNAIIKFLTDNGISQDEISVNPPDIVDMQAEMYGNNNNPYRYNVTSVIVVVSENVDKVRELIQRQSELLRNGIAITDGGWEYRISYEYTDLNSIKPDMIGEATESARLAGQKFANDSHSKLGKIKTATQGQFTIEDRDPNTPYIKDIRVVSTITFYLED